MRFQMGSILIPILLILGPNNTHARDLQKRAIPRELISHAQAARKHFRPVLSSDVSAARNELTQLTETYVTAAKAALKKAASDFNQYLIKKPEFRQGWFKYLKWAQLTDAIEANTPPDLISLNEVLKQFESKANGLEREEFQSVRKALRHFINMATFSKALTIKPLDRKRLDAILEKSAGSDIALKLEGLAKLARAVQTYVHAKGISASPRAKEIYEHKIDALVADLHAYQSSPTFDHSHSIGQTVGWLHNTGQAPALIKGIRSHFAQPNWHLSLSERLLQKTLNQKVDETSKVKDRFNEVDISGIAHTKGTVSLDIVASHEGGAIVLRLKAKSNSKTTSTGERETTVHSSAVTDIVASKKILLCELGVKGDPTKVKCTTTATIDDYSSRNPRIAGRRILRDKASSEKRASRRAETTIRKKLDEATNALEGRFPYEFLAQLAVRDALPKILKLHSTDDRLFGRSRQASQSQLAAPTQAPSLDKAYDLTLQLHHSALNNIAETMLGGKTLTDKDFARLLKQEYSGEEDTPWSITFARNKPFTIEVDSGKIKFTVRGQITREGKESKNMIISATYHPKTTDKGDRPSKLVRDGRIVVNYAKKQRRKLTARQISYRAVLRRRLEKALFKETLDISHMELARKGRTTINLSTDHFKLMPGWLTVGLNVVQ